MWAKQWLFTAPSIARRKPVEIRNWTTIWFRMKSPWHGGVIGSELWRSPEMVLMRDLPMLHMHVVSTNPNNQPHHPKWPTLSRQNCINSWMTTWLNVFILTIVFGGGVEECFVVLYLSEMMKMNQVNWSGFRTNPSTTKFVLEKQFPPRIL